MARLRLFAAIREAAGTTVADMPGATVGEVIDAAIERFGPMFAEQVPVCRVWVNGEPADHAHPVVDADEVALLPPVSGG
jgi:MoaD family protein